tara:strand:- start:560 stop:1810 length:1251 start_codon:yes stop_codon:yes gene_type:complete
MGGLLDKANASKTEDEATKVVATKPKPVAVSTGDSVSKNSKVPSQVASEANPDLSQKLNIAGWVGILLGGILALQGGAAGLLIVCVVLLVGIGLLVQSDRLLGGELNTVKIGISVVIALLVAAGPYVALVMVPSDSSMALTEIGMSEESNEVTFYVRGTFDSATATISVDGAEVWSDTKELSNDRVKFKAPFSAFFEGNAQDYTVASLKSYVIDVVSDDDQTASATITDSIMNREVLNSGARISEVLKTQTSGSTTTTEVDGLIVESIFGLFNPDEGTLEGGEHSMTNLKLLALASDYTVQLAVKEGTTTRYTSPLISVDGLDATWSSSVGGSKSGKTNGWLGLPGTATDSLNTEYLQKDSFYEGAGCYTFEIIISNEFYEGMTDQDSSATGIYVSSNSWELDFDSDKAQRTMETC